MILVDYRTIIKEKYTRQKSISELQYHANGFACHIGKISPGCEGCMTELAEHQSSFIGTICPFKCEMCFYGEKFANIDDEERIKHDVNLTNAHFINKLMDKTYKPSNMCYNSHGEPFLYLREHLKVIENIKKFEEYKNIHMHKRIYTSGIIYSEEAKSILKELDIDEIRFHISASNFSKKVIENMYLASKDGFRITVEEPSWIPHKEKLIEMLPVFEDIGVKHINMDELDVTPANFIKLNNLFPNGRMYKIHNYHLYDEGMTYDIIEEVLKKNFHMSVLDCNSDVIRARFISNRDQVPEDKNAFLNMIDEWEKK